MNTQHTFPHLPDPRTHFENKQVWYYWDDDIIFDRHKGSPITIPAKFLGDGGSIPWVFTAGLKPNGVMLPCYHLHDFLYKKDCPYDITRKHADKLLYEYSCYVDYPWVKRQAVFTGLQVGGWNSWKKHDCLYNTSTHHR